LPHLDVALSGRLWSGLRAFGAAIALACCCQTMATGCGWDEGVSPTTAADAQARPDEQSSPDAGAPPVWGPCENGGFPGGGAHRCRWFPPMEWRVRILRR